MTTSRSSSVVFARTNWAKLLIWYYGPFLALWLLWLAFSDRPARVVFSWANLSSHAGIVRSPLIGWACLVLYVSLILTLTIQQLLNGGKYFWLDGSTLRWVQRNVGNVSDVDVSQISLKEGFFARRLVITFRDQTEKVIPLGVARFDGDLPAEIARTIQNRRTTNR